jgi:hypothetical protein
MKNKIIPVINGAIGIVTKGLKKILEGIPGKYLIDSLPNAAVLGTSHTIREMLKSETWKSERWGSPVIHEGRYQKEKACDRRQQ